MGVSAARGGRAIGSDVSQDNCKPDIWCQLVPFIWAGVVGEGGDG